MSWLELDLLLKIISNVIFPQLLQRITRGYAGTMFQPNGQHRSDGSNDFKTVLNDDISLNETYNFYCHKFLEKLIGSIS